MASSPRGRRPSRKSSASTQSHWPPPSFLLLLSMGFPKHQGPIDPCVRLPPQTATTPPSFPSTSSYVLPQAPGADPCVRLPPQTVTALSIFLPTLLSHLSLSSLYSQQSLYLPHQMLLLWNHLLYLTPSNLRSSQVRTLISHLSSLCYLPPKPTVKLIAEIFL